ncbi:MAG: M15 family metallopeptidase [Candidatus Campbellbacteria bacterium]|nr:M15 family metallopeptidase [Candidatus Campbellbacteria bacterium]
MKKQGYFFSYGFLVILIAGGYVFGGYFITKQNQKVGEIQQTLAEIQESVEENEKVISSSVRFTESNIKKLSEGIEEVEDDFDKQQRAVNKFTKKVESVAKIQSTDKEILDKYSREYFLNEHYIPATLVSIPKKYLHGSVTKARIRSEVLDYLRDMLDDAEDDGVDIVVISAYRSFDHQKRIKTATGSPAVADPGLSEHQLGTTVDVVGKTGPLLTIAFADTEQYRWLTKNAHKYGFTLSYPKDNPYYQYEPWHWRFVGVRLAKELNRSGITFYDMNQRDIYEYLEYTFD